ncbi:S53 family peptidase [Acidicapsa ligni]|uniref:S53 family peptidase n=1 Tax=Acidicapsa ligni TaxID=542300 RepID=UPI0021DFBC04|nr:S53 family peptidase [Acidicapsa ligni]
MLAITVVVLLGSVFPADAQRTPLQASQVAPASAHMLSRVPESQTLRLNLSLPLRNQQQLKALLQQIQTPGSPQYRKYLTVQEFTAQFGPSATDYAKVLSFAKAHRLNVVRTFSNRLVVNVSGSASDIGEAFHVNMQRYQHPTENRVFYAPDVEPTIDTGVPILTVDGLTDLNLPHPMLKHAEADTVHSDQTGSGQGGQFLGSDMRAAYAPGVKLDGAGQTVGLVELGPYNLSDVQLYFSTVNQPLNVPIYNVLLDVDGVCSGIPASGGCDDGEEVIDIEQAISMAPNLSGLIVYEAYGSGSDALTAFAQAASDNVAKQLSLSFGFGGTPSTEPGYEQVFMELAAQGQNLFIASGDSGANVGGVGYPGNSPNVTDVGGTDLTTATAGGPWQSETAWVGSGGGWSTQSPIPTYQVPVINSTNQGSTSFRNIPDISMEANTDNFFCANGQCSGGIGGTSLAAPRWAGFLSLVNEQANGVPVPFLNTTFYPLGQTSSYDMDFHDITQGNDFNSDSPNLFTASVGYDLTSGWGSPNGQAMIDTLAPVSATSANFSLTASKLTLELTPGATGTSTINVMPMNGFDGAVDLSVNAIGMPAGVTATLSQSAITGPGSATLTVSTTGATPGGNSVVAVTGVSGGISHTVYVQLALPDFSFAVTPTVIYLNQGATATGSVSVTPLNGFPGKVSLSSQEALPAGVSATFRPTATNTSSKLILSANRSATTGIGNLLSVSGTSGNIQHTVSSVQFSVSAALGDCGAGIPVNLSSAYNLNGLYTDGTAFTNGGLDGDGFAFSSNILTESRVLSDVLFRFGPANAANAIFGAGQTIKLPSGNFSSLQLLATGINGNQSNQIITVTYSDGTTSKFAQSFSDWFSPSENPSEQEAVAMPYRDSATGTTDQRPFNLYGYTLVLNRDKRVTSITLPNNRNVVILAATLTEQALGTQVNLASAYNAAGIYTDGTTFAADGGIDGGGAAYSANLLGNQSGPSNLVVNTQNFNLAAPNVSNVVFGTGLPISLPQGHFTTLHILGTGVQGNQTDQSVIVTYTDGTKATFTQSFSDWFSPQGYPGEAKAMKMPYRDLNDGSQNAQTFNLYEYTFTINPFKTVKSLTLPNNRFVIAASVTLSLDLLQDVEGLLCQGHSVLPIRK